MYTFQLALWKRSTRFTMNEILNADEEDQKLEKIHLLRKFYKRKAIQTRNEEIEALKTGIDVDDLKVGNLVRKRKSPSQRGTKLESQWEDPFWIVKKCGNGSYWVQGISGNTYKVNRRDLQYIQDDSEGFFIEDEVV